jgi:hypothetical protein
MAQIGRISGPLLEANLLRNGRNLAFRNTFDSTQLLFLDVVDGKVSVNNSVPTHDLYIDGTTQTNNLIVDNGVAATNFSITSNNISIDYGNIFITAPTAVVVSNLETSDFYITDNIISTKTSNANIDLVPNGTGTLEITNNLLVNGDLHATGNITLDGTITFGDALSEDTVDFNTDIASDIVPDQSSLYSLGSSTKRWKDLHINLLNGQTVSTENITVAGLNFGSSYGNIFYVAENGDDTNVGSRQGPLKTIKEALSRVDASSSAPFAIYVLPGGYEEETPLVVPANVSIIGNDIRNTIIRPESAYQSNDVFHLNDSSTVANLTIKDFYYDSVNNTGYAFRFAPDTVMTERSPYIQNVTVLTQEGSVTGVPADIYSDPLGLAGSYTSNSVAVDQINYTQSLVESWIGKALMTWAGEGFPVTFYDIVSVIDEPLDPGYVWRIVLDRDLEDPGEGSYQFSIYPNNGETSIIGTAGYTSATDYSRSFLKSGLPPFFATTVTEFWTCQLGEGLNIVDSVEEDPTNSAWWRVNFKDLATFTNGVPIFTSPSSSGVIPAGQGAWIDGAELNAASINATMLFHSCTFITPNADCINMTNGVRVEWLNSFTYFANKGLNAFNGIDGRVTYDGSTVNYGAELRSIGSANVYGTYGAVADGADCLMYLIQHNFGYIGSGLDSSNDKTLAIQENETVELTGGKIYYQSTDHLGNFRVGDVFHADFETGTTSIDTNAIDFDTLSILTVGTGGNVSTLSINKVETGNVRFSGNRIDSLVGELNIDSASGETNISGNTNLDGSLDIVGNLTFDGTLNLLGNQTTDTIAFNVDFDQDINPNIDSRFTLGTSSKEWLNGFLSETNVGDIRFFDNVLTTTASNANLDLRANGTGTILIPNNNVSISNALTTNGLATLDNVVISGSIINGAGRTQIGDVTVNNIDATGSIDINSSAFFEDISIVGNVITTSSSNSNLELKASGTGEIVFQESLRVENNFTASNIANTGNVTVTDTVTANDASISEIDIYDNVVTTSVSNADLELRSAIVPAPAAPPTDILVPSNNVQIENNLTVNGSTSLRNTNIIGSLLHTSNRTQTGNYNIAGEFTNGDILIEDNFITTTTSNSNLELRASNTGIINIPNNNVTISNNLTVSTDTDLIFKYLTI